MVGAVFWGLFVIVLYVIFEPYRVGQWAKKVKLGFKFSDPVDFDALIIRDKTRGQEAKRRKKERKQNGKS